MVYPVVKIYLLEAGEFVILFYITPQAKERVLKIKINIISTHFSVPTWVLQCSKFVDLRNNASNMKKYTVIKIMF